jgi:DNA-binding HxlR family transcriptional regulator
LYSETTSKSDGLIIGQIWQANFMATKPTTNQITDQAPEETGVHRMCPRYEHATQLLGKRWTGLLLDALMKGSCRFCELTSLVEGLSDRVLSDRLRELEAEGIIIRIVFPQIPVRVEYQLTDKGRALKPVVEAIHTWAEQWIEIPSELTASCQGQDTTEQK